MAPLCEAIAAAYSHKDEQTARTVYRGVVDPQWTVLTYVEFCSAAGEKQRGELTASAST